MVKTAMYGCYIPDLTIAQLLGRLGLDVPLRRQHNLVFRAPDGEVKISLGGATIKAHKLEKFLKTHAVPFAYVESINLVHIGDATRIIKSQLLPLYDFNVCALSQPKGRHVGLPQFDNGIQLSIGAKAKRGYEFPTKKFMDKQFGELLGLIADKTNTPIHKLRCFSLTKDKDVCVT